MTSQLAPLEARPSRRWLTAYQGKRVAVTGASGFIGSCLVRALAAAGCETVCLGRDWAGAADADVVFHLAAQTSVARAAAEPQLDFAANVTPMRDIISSCRQRRRRPFVVFAGTVTQAGLVSRLPVNEDVADEPLSIYDRDKLLAEQELESAVGDGAVTGTTLRLTNVYGPGAPPSRPDRDVLNRMIRMALGGRPLTVYGTGEYVRDYVYIDDVIEAFLLAPLHAASLNGRHFVVGSGRGIAIREAVALIAARVRARTGVDIEIVFEPDRRLSPLERRNFIADASRFIAATSWRPSVSLREGIDRTIEAQPCE